MATAARPRRERRSASALEAADGDGGGRRREVVVVRGLLGRPGQGGVRRPRSRGGRPAREGGGGGGGGGRVAVGGVAAAVAARPPLTRAQPGAAALSMSVDDRAGAHPHDARSTPDSGSSPRRSRRCARSRSASGSAPARATRPTRSPGASHFLEHLLFKGTERRTRGRDRGGGRVGRRRHERVHRAGAHRVLRARPRRAPRARGRDPVRHRVVAGVPADDVDSERQVILEEIRMRDDTPDDLVHELFAGAMFPDHPIGREVIGIARDDRRRWRATTIAGFHAEHYHPSNVVVAAAGNLDHDEVVALVEAALRRRGGRAPGARRVTTAIPPPTPRRRARATDRAGAPRARACARSARDDPDRYALDVLNQVLGGGMSSRLFQEVREQRGLAYSVYSYRAAFEETGALGDLRGHRAGAGRRAARRARRRARPPRRPTAASPTASSTRPRAT